MTVEAKFIILSDVVLNICIEIKTILLQMGESKEM